MPTIVYTSAPAGQRVTYGNPSESAIGLSAVGYLLGSTRRTLDESSVQVSSSGTSVWIYGSPSTPASPPALTNVTLDGFARIINMTSNDSRILYRSPTLPADFHWLLIPRVSNVDIDFALVKSGDKTEILDETLLVYKNEPTIVYEGEWSTVEHIAGIGNATNATMKTSSPGASVSFSFTGTSASAWGACDHDGAQVDVYLDGTLSPETRIHPGPDPTSLPYCPIFSASGLPSSQHTVRLQLNNDSSAPPHLSFDYFQFEPSFSSPSTGSGNVKGVTQTDKVLAFSEPTGKSPGSAIPAGARLVGIIFGSIGIAFFLTILILRRRLFKRRVRPPAEIPPFVLGANRRSATAAPPAPPGLSERKEPPASASAPVTPPAPAPAPAPPAPASAPPSPASTPAPTSMPASAPVSAFLLPPTRDGAPVRGILKKDTPTAQNPRMKFTREPRPAVTRKPIKPLEPFALPPFKTKPSSPNTSDQTPPV